MSDAPDTRIKCKAEIIKVSTMESGAYRVVFDLWASELPAAQLLLLWKAAFPEVRLTIERKDTDG